MSSRCSNVKNRLVIALTFIILSGGCATESRRTILPENVETYRTAYAGEKAILVVGAFQNQSNYALGLFSSNVDRLGNQAKTILKTHLDLTNRFILVDRENLKEIEQESKISGIQQKLTGARYAVTGDVTEFGRKVVGDRQLFGIFGASKEQTAYAKVALSIVDVVTSEVVYSTQGAGEYSLNNREVLGFGGTAAYDATLNGKVLNFAITEAVNNLTRDLQNGIWTAE